MLDLDKHSPIPLYYQLADQIRQQINAGELRPGDQLPAERELSEQASISRMTARQAIAYLVRQGLLVSKIGIGTFVAEPKLAFDGVHLLGFTERMLSQGVQIVSQVLEQTVAVPPVHVAQKLGLRARDKAVKVARVRLHHDLPLALETVYVPARLAPQLESADLHNNSLYAVLHQRYKLQLGAIQQSLEATIANDYEAQLLHVAVGAPMILLEGTTLSAKPSQQPVEYFKAVFRGDRFRFTLNTDAADEARGENGVHTNGATLLPIFR